MATLDQFQKVLNRVQTKTSISLPTTHGKDALTIHGIVFKKFNRLGLLKADLQPYSGILVADLTPEEEKLCKERDVSYLTATGRFYLADKSFTIAVELNRKKSTLQPKRSPLQRLSDPSPTTIISPNGLDILDVLFRLPLETLAQFQSALSFTQEFHLSQPKISIMMTEMNASDLTSLKENIRSLPDSWWETALRYPMTKKGMPPFFENEKLYRSLIPRKDADSALKERLTSKIDFLLPGPLEVTKRFGLIRDDDIYLWATASGTEDLKKCFKLIPDRKDHETMWHVATLPKDFGEWAIISPLAFKKNIDPLLSKIKTNLFRCIWDLGFGDERLREIQVQALRRILDEVR